jgi:hypothetical protein
MTAQLAFGEQPSCPVVVEPLFRWALAWHTPTPAHPSSAAPRRSRTLAPHGRGRSRRARHNLKAQSSCCPAKYPSAAAHLAAPPTSTLPAPDAARSERLYLSSDVGRAPSELKADFPQYELDHLPDIWWHSDDSSSASDGSESEGGGGDSDSGSGSNGRAARPVVEEPDDVFEARIAQARRWLEARPERAIAIVSHWVSMEGWYCEACSRLHQTRPLHGVGALGTKAANVPVPSPRSNGSCALAPPSRPGGALLPHGRCRL